MAYGVKAHQDRDGVKWVDVDSGKGLVLRLCNVGASVYEVKLNGVLMNLAPEPSKFLTSLQFFGKTLGRVAGRMPIDFKVAGRSLSLPEDQDGFCLHGGKETSLSFRRFKVTTIENDEGLSVDFRYLSPAGEAGFPGNAKIMISYFVPKNGLEFFIYFKAVTDADTPLSLTNHIYWDLNNANDVSSQLLSIKADRWGTGNGHSQLVTDISPISPLLDLRDPALLGPRLDRIEKQLPEMTIDHTFIFTKEAVDYPQIELQQGNLKLSLFTDMPAANVYVDSSCTPVEFINGKDLTKKRRAIALEPQEFYLLDPGIILKKGKAFSHFAKYVFSSVRQA